MSVSSLADTEWEDDPIVKGAGKPKFLPPAPPPSTPRPSQAQRAAAARTPGQASSPTKRARDAENEFPSTPSKRQALQANTSLERTPSAKLTPSQRQKRDADIAAAIGQNPNAGPRASADTSTQGYATPLLLPLSQMPQPTDVSDTQSEFEVEMQTRAIQTNPNWDEEDEVEAQFWSSPSNNARGQQQIGIETGSSKLSYTRTPADPQDSDDEEPEHEHGQAAPRNWLPTTPQKKERDHRVNAHGGYTGGGSRDEIDGSSIDRNSMLLTPPNSSQPNRIEHSQSGPSQLSKSKQIRMDVDGDMDEDEEEDGGPELVTPTKRTSSKGKEKAVFNDNFTGMGSGYGTADSEQPRTFNLNAEASSSGGAGVSSSSGDPSQAEIDAMTKFPPYIAKLQRKITALESSVEAKTNVIDSKDKQIAKLEAEVRRLSIPFETLRNAFQSTQS